MPRGDGILFASELKAIVAAVGPELADRPRRAWSRRPCTTGCPQEFDALRGVHRHPRAPGPSTTATARSARGSYWDTAAEAARAAHGPVADVRGVVAESVAAHLVADVPVASFLSGGLDSSIVTALAHRTRPVDRGVHHRLPGRGPAPRGDARRRALRPAPGRPPRDPAARDRDQPRRRRRCSPAWSTSSTSRSATRPPSTPCSCARRPATPASRCCCPGWAPTSCSAATASTWLPARGRALPPDAGHAAVRVSPRPCDALPVAVGGRGLRTVRWAQRFLTFAELPEEEAFRRSYTLYDRDELAGLLDPALAGHVDTVTERHREVYDDNQLDDHVSRMCLADTRMFMPGLNLTYTDRASMAASTEVRVPFVDPVVFGGGVLAARHREDPRPAAEGGRSRTPRGTGSRDEIIDRPKASFGAPLRAWVTNDLRELVDDVLRPRRARRQRLPPACAAAAAGRRPAQRAARRVQAGVAAAEPGALVPQRAGRGGRRG